MSNHVTVEPSSPTTGVKLDGLVPQPAPSPSVGEQGPDFGDGMEARRSLSRLTAGTPNPNLLDGIVGKAPSQRALQIAREFDEAPPVARQVKTLKDYWDWWKDDVIGFEGFFGEVLAFITLPFSLIVVIFAVILTVLSALSGG